MASTSQKKCSCFRAVLLCLTWSAIWTSTVVSAQAAKSFRLNPLTNFCSRWWSQSVVKNDVLYIDSGVQKWNGTDIKKPIMGINSYMITIPLTFTWDWKTNIIINAQAKNETNPATGTLPPSQIRGHMFHGPADKPEVYVYGGTTYMGNQSFEAYAWPDSTAYPLWSYTSGPNYPWNQFATSQTWMPNHGSAGEAIDQGLAFYLNGQIDWGTSSQTVNAFDTQDTYVPLDGMVVLDLNTHTSRNISTSRLRGGAPRVGGSMEYIPSVGGKGVLVALGGQIQPNLTGQYANVKQGALVDFSSVDVFDIDSYLRDPSNNGTWYAQNTTGDIPTPRIDFCTVTMSAPDNSSHHIYLYGGWNPMTKTGYDDVVILTLPSFTWTNVWPIGQSPRWGHNCHVAGNRQMITVGGNVSNSQSCDWEVKGVAVWELTSLTWGSVFMTNLTDYQVPQPILPFTGGSGGGGATIKQPATGWTDNGLKTVFATSRKYTDTPDNPNNNGTAPATPTKKKSHTGAIAGGVLGGLVALAALLALILFLLRRRRNKHAAHELHNDSSSSPHGNELATEKRRHELAAVNEDNPAELFAPHLGELDARETYEAGGDGVGRGAELPGTNVVRGGVAGVPIVRTPGDDLPEPPGYVPGLRSVGEGEEVHGVGYPGDPKAHVPPHAVGGTGPLPSSEGRQ